jgi:hypothetical protein
MKFSAACGTVLCFVAFCIGAAARVCAEPVRTALVLAPRSDDVLLARGGAGFDAALVEVTARVRGELSAAGFRVFTREAPVGVSAEQAVAIAGSDLAPSAVLWIVAASGHTQAAPALEIWLSDRLLGKVSMARLRSANQSSETPKVLAVQAVELLRARMSELRVHDADDAPVPDSAAWVDRPAPLVEPAPREIVHSAAAPAPKNTRERPWLGVSFGLGYLLGSGSLAATPMPTLGLSLGLGEPRAGALPLSCDLGLSAGGFSARERLSEPRGSAQVDQAFGEFRGALRVVTRVPVEPFLALGAGVYSLGVRGQAEPPYQAHRTRYWAPTGSASLGLRSRPFAHLSIVAVAELLQAFSRAEVHVANGLVARAGGSMWLLRAELMGVF